MIGPCDRNDVEIDNREDRLNEAALTFEQSVEAGGPLTVPQLQALYPALPAEDLREIVSGHAQIGQWVGELLDAASAADYRTDGDAPDEDPSRVDPDAEALRIELGAVGPLVRLRRGGIGAVYRCEDAEFGRQLAVKVLRPKYRGQPDIERRFVAEARIGARLEHPGIVRVHDLGRLPDGRPYFTMKLVRGPTLEQLVARRDDVRQDRPRLIKVFEQVCQTLAYAHAKGVIHLDLKSANVMVGEFGEVQVIDWGFAEVVNAGDDRMPGGGTWACMAPEQARGQVEKLDARTDVFGLGAILCHVLTGGPPYRGTTDFGVAEQARTGDLDEALARLGLCSAGAELVALAGRCLSGDPADRPRDAREVAAAVVAYQARVEERRQAAERQRAAAEVRAAAATRTRRLAEATVKVERRARRLAALAVGLLLIAVAALTVDVVRVTRAQARTEHDLYVRRIPEAGRALSSGYRDEAEKILNSCPADLRHVEWYLLKRACQPDALPPIAHNDIVTDVIADLAEGRLLATKTSGRDRMSTVTLRDAATHESRGVIDRRRLADFHLVAGYRGTYLAQADEDGVLTVWDVTRAGTPKVFKESAGKIVALARDAPMMATAGRGQTVTVRDLPSGHVTHVIDHAQITSPQLALSPDGKWLAIGGMIVADDRTKQRDGRSRSLTVWDLTAAPAREVNLSHDLPADYPVYNVAWGGPTGQYLLVTINGAVRILAMPMGRELGVLHGFCAWSTSPAFDRTGRRVTVGFKSGAIRVWTFGENDAPELIFSAFRSSAPINSVSLSASGERVFYTRGAGVVVERCDNHGGVWTTTGHVFAYSPDCGRLAVAAAGAPVQVLDRTTGHVEIELPGQAAAINALAFRPPRSDRLATAAQDGTLKFWDLSTGREIQAATRQSGDHSDPILCVAYNRDGSLLATSTAGGTSRVSDTGTGRTQFESKLVAAVPSMAFSADGKHLAAACRDFKVYVWDVLTWRDPTILSGHQLGATCVSFSPDGRWLASASEDQTVRLRDMRRELGTEARILPHTTAIASVAFSPDGQRLVSAGHDGRVYFWETATGEQLLALERPPGAHKPRAVQVATISRPWQLITAFDDGSRSIEVRNAP
jgi:WD40 repeat protein